MRNRTIWEPRGPSGNLGTTIVLQQMSQSALLGNLGPVWTSMARNGSFRRQASRKPLFGNPETAFLWGSPAELPDLGTLGTGWEPIGNLRTAVFCDKYQGIPCLGTLGPV